MTGNLILLRHGRSEWNEQNRFSGWQDVDLTAEGEDEAHRAASALRQAGATFDIAYTSLLTRAIRTLWIVLDDLDRMWIPVRRDWRLNERSYGALQGLDKDAATRQQGGEQVHRWRRGYASEPPELSRSDPRWPGYQERYADVPAEDLPTTESLAESVARVDELLHDAVYPELRAGRSVLIVVHGNSLRAVSKLIEKLGARDVETLEIPTGVPIVYRLDEDLGILEQHWLDRDTEPG